MTQGDSSPYIAVASMAPDDATTAIFFRNLADRAPLRIVSSSVGALTHARHAGRAISAVASTLAGASALILVRSLLEFGNLSSCARWLGIPRYYFTDDNFMMLREEAVDDSHWYGAYSVGRVRHALGDFSGVLLATPTLLDYFDRERLHDRTLHYPPIAGPLLDRGPRREPEVLTVGFFGGHHRRDAFLEYVYPALRRWAEQRDVRLVAAGFDARQVPSTGRLQVVALPYNGHYSDALHELGSHSIDVLVHPGRRTGHHHAFKNTHVIVNAHALGAVPIFSRIPPYDAIGDDRVALLCENSAEAWYEALARVASNPALREAIRSRMAEYCATHFGGARNLEVMSMLLRDHPRPTAATRTARLLSGAAFRGLGLGHQLMARSFKRLA
ncbi:MAG: hypothetical protein ACRD2N_22965 [Vicinamibacterales bacterium]